MGVKVREEGGLRPFGFYNLRCTLLNAGIHELRCSGKPLPATAAEAGLCPLLIYSASDECPTASCAGLPLSLLYLNSCCLLSTESLHTVHIHD